MQEARALLGRIEYQKGNIEAALHVFEGIDIAALTPKMKLTLSRRGGQHKRQSQNFATPQMSVHAVSLLLEAIFLKAKSLQHLRRFKGAFCLMVHTFVFYFANYYEVVCFVQCFNLCIHFIYLFSFFFIF